MLALEHQLAESERMAAGHLQQLQLEALTRLLKHARDTVPYYRDQPGYDRATSGHLLSHEDWATFPVLTRAKVQEAGPALTSERVPPDHEPLSQTTTSGSTGRPLRAVGTYVTALFWAAITLRDQLWHQRDISARLSVIRPEGSDRMPASGLELPGWGPSIDSAYPTGPCGSFSIQHDVSVQAEWLVAQDPEYLLTLPSNLVALAQHFRATGATLPRLREVCSYGEAVGPRVREVCRAAWGVPLTDMYSTQELGYVALQCPASEQYHVQSEAVYVEVLGPGGEPCEPGETGRVVVSTLHNYAMPLLRYEVGDYAEVGESCPCGRTLPLLARVLGRQRNMLCLPTGEKVWPTFPAAAWAHIDAIRQLQLVQLDLDRIEARVVGPRPMTAEEESQFASMVRTRFGYPFSVSFSYLDRIDRTQTMKFEDFVSRVGA